MNIHSLLENYRGLYPSEFATTEKFHALASVGDNAYNRDHFSPGHFTGSAWILSPDQTSVALIFHRKLQRWLQPGGHADGDHILSRVALREAEEETGLTDLSFICSDPLDLDIHAIAERNEVPAHLHYDLRFLLQARSEEFVLNHVETSAVEWVPLNEINPGKFEDGICRMAEKSKRYLKPGNTTTLGI